MLPYDDEQIRECSKVSELPKTFAVERTEADVILANELEKIKEGCVDSSGQSRMIEGNVVDVDMEANARWAMELRQAAEMCPCDSADEP
jgi:hypothetical protein